MDVGTQMKQMPLATQILKMKKILLKIGKN